MTWYLVRSATRQEHRAVASLKEAKFEAYYPKLTRWERIGRYQRRDIRQSALFPSYVFVQIPDGCFATVEAADGVSGVLRYMARDGVFRPRQIPHDLVSELQEAEAAGAFDRTMDHYDDGKPKPGDRMRVKSGGWWGHIATIKGMHGPHRVKVLLALFGRENEVTMDIAQLEPV